MVSRRPTRHPRKRAALVAGVLLALAAPSIALAHPLGNFTINHYSGLRVAADRILVDQVFDLAEIAAFEALQATDGGFGPQGPTDYARARCAELAPFLTLEVGPTVLPLEPAAAVAALRPGQGGLDTLRLECAYRASLPGGLTGPTQVRFADRTWPERIGWREIVVEAEGVAIEGAGLLTSGLSERLTRYPESLTAQPPEMRAVDFSAAPTGVAVSGGLTPLPTVPAAGSARGPDAVGATAGDLVLAPGGAVLPAELAALIRSDAATPAVLIGGLLLAVVLGALHALTPGHGKTIMAAYLVSTRGDVPRALGLGLTVAVSHTAGVLLLALVVLAASSVLSPERLVPLLSVVSGVLVVLIGAWLLMTAGRRLRLTLAERRAHRRAHANGIEHDHDDHHHDHHDRHDRPDDDGTWHEHGGVRHRHHAAADDAGRVRWRSIVALGLAGGLVPSASAILLLLGALAAGRPALGLALVIAFGLGMAAVLGAIGLLLVGARGLIERLPAMAGDARLGQLVSLVAGATVLGLGIVLTATSVGQLWT